ncbi:MAG: hypothetical protein RLY31_2970 [Bacteroidota bacterium]|jgi:hypothetical protein
MQPSSSGRGEHPIEDILSELSQLGTDTGFLRDRQGKDPGFRVPAGYFSRIPDWESLRSQPHRRRSSVRRLPAGLAAAAAVLLLAIGAYWRWTAPGTDSATPFRSEQQPAALSDIPSDELEAFLRYNIRWMDADLFGSAGTDAALTERSFTDTDAVDYLEHHLDEFTTEELSEDI